ncbi:hypothetical protein EKG40_08300 [Pseudomonas moorei]|nr:hypothetical protein EKG40_08300 [Pseudomonas moorei]
MAGFTGSYIVSLVFSEAQQLNACAGLGSLSVRQASIFFSSVALVMLLVSLERSLVCSAKDISKAIKPSSMPDLDFKTHCEKIEHERGSAACVALICFDLSLPLIGVAITWLTNGWTFMVLLVACSFWVLHSLFRAVTVIPWKQVRADWRRRASGFFNN